MLEQVPIFSNLPEDEIAQLETIAQKRVIRKNTVVINEGDQTDSLYILLSGKANAIRCDESGRELVVNRIKPFDCFGEMSLLDGEVRSATVETKEKCEMMVISRRDFHAFAEKRPQIYWNVIEYLLSKLRSATRQIQNLAFLDVYGRLAQFLIENQDENGVLSEKLTQQDIAGIVGTSRETVSRIFSQLQDGGYIARKKGRTILLKKLPYKF